MSFYHGRRSFPHRIPLVQLSSLQKDGLPFFDVLSEAVTGREESVIRGRVKSAI